MKDGLIDVVAAVDVNPEALQNAREGLGLRADQCYTDLGTALDRNPAGGIHHLCYEVADVAAASQALAAAGARVLGPRKTGAHGKPVVFLHPKDFLGTLIELEQV